MVSFELPSTLPAGSTSCGGLAIASTCTAFRVLGKVWHEKTENKLLIICKGCFVTLLIPLGVAIKVIGFALAIAYLPIALIVTLVGVALGAKAHEAFGASYFWLVLVLYGLEILYLTKYLELKSGNDSPTPQTPDTPPIPVIPGDPPTPPNPSDQPA
ncbi:MAG: hypothetical protein LBS68_01245 [Puniceicoccales bacterium]|jgi:hypothetical protein|nr:hypothetical protein [Puniceicoccales bacterium]